MAWSLLYTLDVGATVRESVGEGWFTLPDGMSLFVTTWGGVVSFNTRLVVAETDPTPMVEFRTTGNYSTSATDPWIALPLPQLPGFDPTAEHAVVAVLSNDGTNAIGVALTNQSLDALTGAPYARHHSLIGDYDPGTDSYLREEHTEVWFSALSEHHFLEWPTDDADRRKVVFLSRGADGTVLGGGQPGTEPASPDTLPAANFGLAFGLTPHATEFAAVVRVETGPSGQWYSGPGRGALWALQVYQRTPLAPFDLVEAMPIDETRVRLFFSRDVKSDAGALDPMTYRWWSMTVGSGNAASVESIGGGGEVVVVLDTPLVPGTDYTIYVGFDGPTVVAAGDDAPLGQSTASFTTEGGGGDEVEEPVALVVGLRENTAPKQQGATVYLSELINSLGLGQEAPSAAWLTAHMPAELGATVVSITPSAPSVPEHRLVFGSIAFQRSYGAALRKAVEPVRSPPPPAVPRDFREHVRNLSPGFLRGPRAERFMGVLGLMLDAVCESALLNVFVRNTLSAAFSGTAIKRLASERGLPRYPGESAGAWLLRVEDAWRVWRDAGSAEGVVAQLDAIGVGGTIVDPVEFGYDADAADWSRRLVVLGEGVFQRGGTLGDGQSVLGAGKTLGSTASRTQVEAVRRAVRAFKPGHIRVPHILVPLEPGAIAASAPDGTWFDPAHRPDNVAFWEG